jgi:hypothetical protein
VGGRPPIAPAAVAVDPPVHCSSLLVRAVVVADPAMEDASLGA